MLTFILDVLTTVVAVAIDCRRPFWHQGPRRLWKRHVHWGPVAPVDDTILDIDDTEQAQHVKNRWAAWWRGWADRTPDADTPHGQQRLLRCWLLIRDTTDPIFWLQTRRMGKWRFLRHLEQYGGKK